MVITNILEIKYLDYLGILFSLDSCVVCGNKNNIVTIDADKGGFVCKNCVANEVIVDIKVIKMMRMYYYVKIEGIKDIKIDDGIIKSINMFLDMYYDRYAGLYLNSKDFLKKLL